MRLSLSHVAPAFSEILPLLHQGEKTILWVPANAESPEPTVYEIELVDVIDMPGGKQSHTPG